MAHVLNRDQMVYDKEKERFLKELQHFHETRGTPSRRTPKINGHEIDLYLLYILVTTRGGWVKVNSRNEWEQILTKFSIPKFCVNGAVAIKQIYLRYLDRYEKMHYLGEVGERGGDDDEDSRHRRWSARALHSVPLSYNHAQHTFNESLRAYNGLTVDLYRESDYEKLGLSLISPLPNEQDFAVNVCTVLSNEGKHCLKLEKHPRILHYLLAHAAVYNDPSLKKIFHEMYGIDRGHPMHYFWRDVVGDKDVLKLIDDNSDQTSNSTVEVCGKKCEVNTELSDTNLFCLGRSLGTQEFVGQRVSQIATILHNLSFLPENASVMARDITFLRFALLCCCSSWNGLVQIGWDMLSNIASDLPSNSPLAYDLLIVTTRGLLSDDRGVILSSLDVLNKLSQSDSNEHILLSSLNQEVFDRLCSFLTLHDIMLLVCTLECLNAISSLGEQACNSIVRVRGAVDVLVSLITVEAQSYGPKACIQMRVVETVVGSTGSSPVTSQSSQNNTVTTSVGSVTATVTTTVISSSSSPLNSTVTLTPPSSSTAVPLVAALSSSNTTTMTPTAVTSSQQTSPLQLSVPTPLVASSSPTSSHRASTTTTSLNCALATQQVAQENEQFALVWLRNTFEPLIGGSIEQAELYKQYINYCAGIGRRGVIAPLHFPRCVRSVFGGSVGPKPVIVGETTQHHYEGIKLRNKPLIPTVANNTVVVSSVLPNLPSTPSPILKAQLSAPPKPSSQTSPAKITQRHFHPQVRLPLQQANIVHVNSVIRSLIEEKPRINNIALKTPTVNCKINGLRTDVQDKQVETSGTSVIVSCENHHNKPIPVAQLSGNNKVTQHTALTPSGHQHLAVVTDETASSTASSGNRDNCSGTGGEEGDNSRSSSDGFLLNGVPSSLDLGDTTSKDSTPKSMMLADLLEKNSERKEPPPLNGALRLVERGLELAHAGGPTSGQLNGTVTPNVTSHTSVTSVSVITSQDLKRPNPTKPSEVPQPKKPHLNGDIMQDKGPPEEGNVSSSAANLYAALAADAVEDEPVEGVYPTNVGSVNAGGGGMKTTVGTGGTTNTKIGGITTSGMGGTTNTKIGGITTSGMGGTTNTKKGGIITNAGVGGIATAGGITTGGVGSITTAGVGGITSTGVGGITSAGVGGIMSAGVGGITTTAGVGGITATGVGGLATSNVVQGQVVMQASNPGTGQHTRQILVTTGTGLTQRVVVGGQHYVVAQPQTALVQHGTQTVLLAQTAQQQGTGAKTIIILQPQGVTANNNTGTGKVIMQRLGGSPPPPQSSLISNTNRQGMTTNHIIVSSTPSVASTTQTVSNQTYPHHIHFSQHTKKTIITAANNTGATSSTLGNSNIGNVSMPSLPAPCATPVSVMTGAKTCITPNVGPSSVSTSTVSTPSVTTTRNPLKIGSESQGHFLCEWRGCMRNFRSANEVYMHACETHCPQGSQEIQCLWERCDAMKRKRFSLMTHLYDRHCNADVMKMMAVRRKQLSVTGRSEIPAPIVATPHPGYAPNAAFHAIKRHALEFVNPKELQDDNEGPVTKSIRLTAALILRNIVVYSPSGKRYLTRYEPHLASVALSNVESSRTIAHVLFDMNQTR